MTFLVVVFTLVVVVVRACFDCLVSLASFVRAGRHTHILTHTHTYAQQSQVNLIHFVIFVVCQLVVVVVVVAVVISHSCVCVCVTYYTHFYVYYEVALSPPRFHLLPSHHFSSFLSLCIPFADAFKFLFASMAIALVAPHVAQATQLS